LTTPDIPTFLLLLLLTAPTTIILSLPLYIPLARRAAEAYQLSWSSEIRERWYSRRWSWILAISPLWRYGGGTILGWRALDRMDGGGFVRLELGAVVFIGIFLGLITTVSPDQKCCIGG